MDKIGDKMIEIVAHAGKHKIRGQVPAACCLVLLKRSDLLTRAT